MQVYVVIADDRHADPEPEVFTDPGKAIAYAREQAVERAHEHDTIDDSDTPDGWLYHAVYCVEGDSVWVVEKELNGSAPNVAVRRPGRS